MDTEILQRFWTDLIGRVGGPMNFRFFLQPGMALIFAVRDGIRDGRTGRTPYFWLIARSDAKARRAALREGVKTTMWIFLFGIVLDAIYQWRVMRMFYPLEAIVTAMALAFVPYLLLRGPVARITRRWVDRRRTEV